MTTRTRTRTVKACIAIAEGGNEEAIILCKFFNKGYLLFGKTKES